MGQGQKPRQPDLRNIRGHAHLACHGCGLAELHLPPAGGRQEFLPHQLCESPWEGAGLGRLRVLGGCALTPTSTSSQISDLICQSTKDSLLWEFLSLGYAVMLCPFVIILGVMFFLAMVLFFLSNCAKAEQQLNQRVMLPSSVEV
ncbi:uncharacterized protein LOC128931127 [Callithrix jacchus]